MTALALHQMWRLTTVLAVLVAANCADDELDIPICTPNPTAGSCKRCCADLVAFDLDPALQQVTITFDGWPEYGGALLYIVNRTRGVGVVLQARADGFAGPAALPASVGEEIEVALRFEEHLINVCVIVLDGDHSHSCIAGRRRSTRTRAREHMVAR